MLKGIEFTDKRFKIEDDYNVLAELTENTIILCNNYKLMDSLAKEILDKNNGTIDIKSQKGKGTEVVIKIPTK